MKQDRKPRSSEIRVDFGKEQILSGMEVSDDGTLTFFDENGQVVSPEKIDIGSAYMRTIKGPKVLTRVASEPEKIQLDPNRLLSRFASVFAVDTNTLQVGQVVVSMSASVFITNIEIGEKQWNVTLVPGGAFEFHNASAPPERIGWWELIKAITSTPDIRRPVAIVVDSELGSLAAINSRREPILEGFYLPDGIELIYGCGDRGTQEFIANASIADCDRAASQLLKRLCNEGMTGAYFSEEGTLFTKFRYWTPPKGGS